MSQNIYIRNLSPKANGDEVRSVFAAYGPVQSVRLVSSRQSGRPRTYGVVQMAPEEAQAAMSALNGTLFQGRRLHLSRTGGRQRSRTSRPGGHQR